MHVDLSTFSDRDGLVRVGALDDPGFRRNLDRAVDRGEYIRLARGACISAAVWLGLDRHAKYRARIHAAAVGRLHPHDLVAGPSAAALWRLPWLDAWPETVHLLRTDVTGGRHSSSRRPGGLVRHTAGQRDDGARIDRLPVTSLARTVADAAATTSMAASVMVADAALRGITTGFVRAPLDRDALIDCCAARPVRRGRTRALRVAQFADARAGSAGESLVRVTLHRLGVPPPELQVEFRGASGAQYFADFYWPDQDFVLEFDGKVKLTDPGMRGGRSAEEVLFDEKLREDEIRAQVRGFARADWRIGRSAARLAERLRRAGFIFPRGWREPC